METLDISMLEFFLFFISFLTLIFSSFIFTLVLEEKKLRNIWIYFLLILISQVIIGFEILSILKSINIIGVLSSNAAFLSIALILAAQKPGNIIDLLKKSQGNKILLQIKRWWCQLIHRVWEDKILVILLGFFIFSCLMSLFFVILTPTSNLDSHAYRLARVALWVQHETLAHFEVTDFRQVIFPINWELLILWPQVFIKKDYLAQFPAFFSYLGSLGIVYCFLKSLDLSLKRILWTILILGSLPIVVLEASSTQSDLFIGFLLLSCFYLFYDAVKTNKKLPLIFSSIAFAIALGAKSTAFLFIPAFVVVFLIIAHREKQYKSVASFVLYFIPAFMLLSSFNYVLNFLNYNNIFGPSSIIKNHILQTPETLFSSFVLYLTYFVDFSGITGIKTINPYIIRWFSDLNIINGVSLGPFEGINWRIHEHHSSFGLLGYLLILPMTIFGLSKLKTKNNKAFYLSLCGLFISIFFLTVLVVMGYSVWLFRYFASAMILSAPVLAFSYSKKAGVYKILIAAVVVFNYSFMSLFNDQKPFFRVINLYSKAGSFDEFRQDLRLRSGFDFSVHHSEYMLLNHLKRYNIPDDSRIGLILGMDDFIYHYFEEYPDWKIYPLRYDKFLERKNFDDYDYLIAVDNQVVNLLSEPESYKYFGVRETRQIYFTEAEDEARSFYLSRDGGILLKGEGEPIKRVNFIEDKKLLPYYKKIGDIIIKNAFKSRNRRFKIYKRNF